FVRGFADDLPLSGGVADLSGELLEVFYFRKSGGELLGFSQLRGRAVFKQEWQDGEDCAEHDVESARDDFPASERLCALKKNKGGEGKQKCVAGKEWPFGY